MFAQSEQNIPHPDFSHPKKGIKRSGLNFLLKKKKNDPSTSIPSPLKFTIEEIIYDS